MCQAARFNTINPQVPQLLTINPSAYLFNQVAPGAIANSSRASADFNPSPSSDDGFFGLRVPDGKSLLLLGGDVNAVGGGLIANGGQIEIGAIADKGIVGINENGSLNIPDKISRGDVSLTNGAGFLVAGDGGGDIAIAAKNVSIDLASSLTAGIFNMGSPEAQAGDIDLNATGTISVKDNSYIFNNLFSGVTGKGGNISIQAGNLVAKNGGTISASTFSEGNSGNISVTANNEIALDDSSYIVNNVQSSDAVGNAGNINITTGSLSATEGSQINSFTRGKGNAGDITIQATDAVTFDGVDSNGNYSSAYSTVEAGGVGNGGNVNITADSLSLTNGGELNASIRETSDSLPGAKGLGGNININVDDTLTIAGENTRGIFVSLGAGAVGSAGNLDIQAGNLVVRDGGEISASSSGLGSASDITIQASELIEIKDFGSRISSEVNFGALGDAGNINLETKNLTISNQGQISALTIVGSNGGNINVNANVVKINNGSTLNTISGIINSLEAPGSSNAGELYIQAADSIEISGNNSGLITSSLGLGNAGGITLSTKNLIIKNAGLITSSAVDFAGILKILPDNFDRSLLINLINLDPSIDGAANEFINNITNGNVATEIEQGDSGDIAIQASESINIINGADIITSGTGNAVGGDISISTPKLNLQQGIVTTSTAGAGDSGKISIHNAETVEIVDGTLSASTSINSSGDGGDLNIFTQNLFLREGGLISTSTQGTGDAGNLYIIANSIELNGGVDGLLTGLFASVEEGGTGDGGSIFLGNEQFSTQQLTLNNGAQIIANTFSEGNAGNLFVFAKNIDIDGGENGSLTGLFAQVREDATGDGGSINLGSEQFLLGQLNLTNGAIISVSTNGQGDAGNLSIFSKNVDINGGENGSLTALFAQVVKNATGQGGNINIGSEQFPTEQLNLKNGAQITVSTNGQGKAGEIKINANSFNLNNDALISSSSKSTFDAGNITLDIVDFLQATDSSISTSSDKSSGGNLAIATGNIQLRGNSDFTTNISSGEGSGGNIAIEADSILAFDDSDIFASAPEGQGGDITLDTPAFFAENFTLNSLTANPNLLENNNRTDVNATGNQPGIVSIPDVSFIQNSLTELPDNSINTDELVANSCVVPVGDRSQGKFIITGGESLPVRPGENLPSKYSTGEVRGASEDNTSSWQPGEPIVEPQDAYRLANGKMVLSRECN